MILLEKYDYNELKRVTTIDKKRKYQLPDGSAVPSVTTILDATKSQEQREALANWKKRVGEQQAQQISTEAANVGTLMHKNLELYIESHERKVGSNVIHQKAYNMSNVIIAEGLRNVSEIYGTEVSLYYEGLYAGTTDCVGLWKGNLAILDFKQTNKPKKKEWIKDYYCQLAAYAQAHNEMFGTDIKTGVVLMCSRDLDYQEFVIEGQEFENAVEEWNTRVAQYYNLDV
jgi:genome maintenance exonuclease 1